MCDINDFIKELKEHEGIEKLKEEDYRLIAQRIIEENRNLDN